MVNGLTKNVKKILTLWMEKANKTKFSSGEIMDTFDEIGINYGNKISEISNVLYNLNRQGKIKQIGRDGKQNKYRIVKSKFNKPAIRTRKVTKKRAKIEQNQVEKLQEQINNLQIQINHEKEWRETYQRAYMLISEEIGSQIKTPSLLAELHKFRQLRDLER